jgi:hypothetical protein
MEAEAHFGLPRKDRTILLSQHLNKQGSSMDAEAHFGLPRKDRTDGCSHQTVPAATYT